MIDIKNIKETVAAGLSEYLGCTVIRANQNRKIPAYPYVTYTIINIMDENNGTYEEWDDNTHRKAYLQTWSITALSDDDSESVALANKAHEWLNHYGRVYLGDNDVIVKSVGIITNRDNFITVGYEHRNGFDAVLRVYNTVENPIKDYIETVALDNRTAEYIDYNDILEKRLSGEEVSEE